MATRIKRHAAARWLGALSLSATAVLATGPLRAATPSCRYGVNAHQASNATLDLAAAAGIGWVRFDMNWLQFEPAQGNFDWTESDRFVDHASSLGLNVYITVAYTPPWAVGVACNDADPNPVNWCHNALPANGADWTSFLTAAVSRYGAEVKAWGMWNEPNLGEFFKGTRDDYVNEILVPGSAAVHAACPDCQVMGPELATLRNASWDATEGQCVGNQCRFNGWNYSLIHVLQAAGDSIDVVTHHKYTDPASGWWSEALDGQWQVIQLTDGIKTVTDQYAPGKPVWITELGWESEPYGDVTNAYAADMLTQMYQDMDQVIAGTMPGVTNQPWPELARLFWYDVQDDPNGYSWGLIDETGVPKPPYDAYAAVITQLGDCSGSGGTGAGGSGQGGSGAGVGAGGSGQGGSGTGAGAVGGHGTGDSGSGANAASAGEDAGCGCRLPASTTSPSGARLAALAAASAALRRRRGKGQRA
jgi:hypothetical protein